MNLFSKFCTLLLILLALQSCIDSEYNWDNINTEGVLNIPPIPLGNYEVTLNRLDFDVQYDKGIEIPSFTFQFDDTIKDIFSSNSVKDFFHEYMTRDLSIEGELDMNVLTESNISIDIQFNVLDVNNKIIKQVEIEGTDKLQPGKQNLTIIFPKEDAIYMKDSEHLLLKVRVRTPNQLFAPKDTDYILLKDLIIKTGGYYVEL